MHGGVWQTTHSHGWLVSPSSRDVHVCAYRLPVHGERGREVCQHCVCASSGYMLAVCVWCVQVVGGCHRCACARSMCVPAVGIWWGLVCGFCMCAMCACSGYVQAVGVCGVSRLRLFGLPPAAYVGCRGLPGGKLSEPIVAGTHTHMHVHTHMCTS